MDEIKNNTTLEIDSLKKRCVFDITNFLEKTTLTPNINEIPTEEHDINLILLNENNKSYDYYKQWFCNISKNTLKITYDQSTYNVFFEKFDYSHDVSLSTDTYFQNQMWIVRTLMFYTLLVDVSKQISKYSTYDVSNYKLGIFGSITATSDIDIGFTYKGVFTIKDSRGPLSFAINKLENLFFEKMGVDSLKMDIEPYADLMTYTEAGLDKYYMDTEELTHENFVELLPYVGAGMMRNYIQSNIDLGYNEDTRRQKINKTKSETTESEISKSLTNILLSKSENYSKIIDAFIQLVFKTDKTAEITNALFGKDAIGIIMGYLGTSYDNGRKKYYELVNAAETKFAEYVNNKNPETVLELLKLTSHALVYRAESYVFSNTVMDVVLGYQAGQNEKIKNNPGICTDSNKKQLYAPCLIGKYGYVISLLENIGYIWRFMETYCANEKKNPEKCSKKNAKYLIRVSITFELLKQKLESESDIFNKIEQANYIQSISVQPKEEAKGGRRKQTRAGKLHRRGQRLTRRRQKTHKYKSIKRTNTNKKR
jgi:hypothetical protein